MIARQEDLYGFSGTYDAKFSFGTTYIIISIINCRKAR